MSGHHESTEEIRRDIARTQHEMSGTIDEIQYRLSPEHLKESARESVRRAGRNATQSIRRAGVSTSRNTIDRMKANPLGVALVGAGLWMLIRNDEHEDSYSHYGVGEGYDVADDLARDSSALDQESGDGRIQRAMSHARERVSEKLDDVRESASTVRDRAGLRVHDLRERAASRTRDAGNRSRDFISESPLIAGIVGLAAGALLGAMIPETERENEMFGDARDRVADRASDLAHQGLDQARNVASAVASAATETAKRETKNARGEMQNETRSDLETRGW